MIIVVAVCESIKVTIMVMNIYTCIYNMCRIVDCVHGKHEREVHDAVLENTHTHTQEGECNRVGSRVCACGGIVRFARVTGVMVTSCAAIFMVPLMTVHMRCVWCMV